MKTRMLLTAAVLCLAGPAFAQGKATPQKGIPPKTTEAKAPATPPAAPEAARPTARADLKDQKGQSVGEVTLTETPLGVLMKGSLTGVAGGDHAFHVHETGKCEAPFTTAGGHFNPDKKKHGMLSTEGQHAGDLPNIHVGSDGKAQFDAFAPGLKLKDLQDADGSAVVVHATSDDYKSDPAGNAGDRIACGVVQAQK